MTITAEEAQARAKAILSANADSSPDENGPTPITEPAAKPAPESTPSTTTTPRGRRRRGGGSTAPKPTSPSSDAITAKDVQLMITDANAELREEIGTTVGEMLATALAPVTDAINAATDTSSNTIAPTSVEEADALAARLSSDIDATNDAARQLIMERARHQVALDEAEERRQALQAKEAAVKVKAAPVLEALGLADSASSDSTDDTVVIRPARRLNIDLGSELSPETANLLGDAISQAADTGASRAVDELRPQMDATAKALVSVMKKVGSRGGLFGRNKIDFDDDIVALEAAAGLTPPEPAPAVAPDPGTTPAAPAAS